MGKRDYQVCQCCVMDTSDEYIKFDENGICSRCNEFKQRILPEWNYGNGHEEELQELISSIKKSGKGIRLYFRVKRRIGQFLYVASCDNRVGTSSICIPH